MVCIASFLLQVTKIISQIPPSMASLATCSIRGLSYLGSSSFGIALDAGSIRVINPATGITVLQNLFILKDFSRIPFEVNKYEYFVFCDFF